MIYILFFREMNGMNKLTNHLNRDLLQLDAIALAEKIKNREITSYEITETLIEHIKIVNQSLNAVVEERFESALEEAKEKDREINKVNFDVQPLYGVPISIKESFHVKGMKTTGGVYHRKDLIMNKDAVVVEKLKKAGAIILCKTNTPALCFCHETENTLYGRTDRKRDV